MGLMNSTLDEHGGGAIGRTEHRAGLLFRL